MAAGRQQQNKLPAAARRLVERLRASGVTISAAADGEITVSPLALVTAEDCQVLVEHKDAVRELIGRAQVAAVTVG